MIGHIMEVVRPANILAELSSFAWMQEHLIYGPLPPVLPIEGFRYQVTEPFTIHVDPILLRGEPLSGHENSMQKRGPSEATWPESAPLDWRVLRAPGVRNPHATSFTGY